MRKFDELSLIQAAEKEHPLHSQLLKLGMESLFSSKKSDKMRAKTALLVSCVHVLCCNSFCNDSVSRFLAAMNEFSLLTSNHLAMLCLSISQLHNKDRGMELN